MSVQQPVGSFFTKHATPRAKEIAATVTATNTVAVPKDTTAKRAKRETSDAQLTRSLMQEMRSRLPELQATDELQNGETVGEFLLRHWLVKEARTNKGK